MGVAGRTGEEVTEKDKSGAWTGSLVPSAAASLCEAGQHSAGAALAGAHIGLHPALATATGSLSMMQSYLQGHERAVQAAGPAAPLLPGEGETAADITLPQAVAQVWHGLAGQCRQAITRLKQDFTGT